MEEILDDTSVVNLDEDMGACTPPPGGDSNMKMPGCVCWVSENLPILNGTFSHLTYPY